MYFFFVIFVWRRETRGLGMYWDECTKNSKNSRIIVLDISNDEGRRATGTRHQRNEETKPTTTGRKPELELQTSNFKLKKLDLRNNKIFETILQYVNSVHCTLYTIMDRKLESKKC